MADWRVAKSLETLRDEVNARWPNRSKSDDGTIGDAAHQATNSDHNPNANGVVTALDLTHDPAHGFDSYAFADVLQEMRDSRIKYIISNRRISNPSIQNWAWRHYTGADPHTGHIHISVSANPALYDDATPWVIVDPHIDPGPVTPPSGPAWLSGKGGWYSQYKGKYNWVDTGDAPNSNALGVPDWAQGIARYDRSTLGKWWTVVAPNGLQLILPQTDIGPSPSTGRTIDISAVAAERFGYTPNNFPTDGVFRYQLALTPAGLENLSPQQQAIQFATNQGGVAVHDVKWMQGILGVDQDGIVGPKTVAAMIKRLEGEPGG